MSTGLLPASVLPGLLEIALKSRLNVQALFDRAGIDPDAVGRADRYITYEQLDTLLSTAFREAEDPFFGIHVGQDNHYSTLDLLGNLMATSDTLGMALQMLLSYKDLLVPYLHFELRPEGDLAALSISPDAPLNFTRMRTHNEIILATAVSIGRSLLGGDMGLIRVRMRHGPPSHLTVYREFFGVPLEFDQPRNELVMRAEKLSEPLPTAYPRYQERLREIAEQQLQRLSRARGVAGQVLVVLEERLGRMPSRIEEVAGAMNLTPRTLQRRLRAEGVSFARLRDQVRHQRAREALLAEQCDMQELALFLGFSDTANFYHAFKRWEGCAPGAWRKQHRS